MNTILASILGLATFNCTLTSFIDNKHFEDSFTLSPEKRSFTVEKKISTGTHFWYLNILEYNAGRKEFQFMEGDVVDNAQLPTSGFAMDIREDQDTIRASSFACPDGISCWDLLCKAQ